MSDLSRLMQPVLDQLVKLRSRVDHMPTVRRGTVASLSPLTVLLDGSLGGDPSEVTSTVAGLAEGDRVVCVEQHRRVIVVGRAGGVEVPRFAIGEYRHGLWTAETVPAGTLPADGSVHNIADWPLLAAHFAEVFGTVNHFGGDGVTTFGMPDSRELTTVNQGGSDIFAVLGATVGAKTHVHPLSDAGQAQVTVSTPAGTGGVYARTVATAAWAATGRITGTVTATGSTTVGAALAGETDSASTVQPSFIVRVAIQAA